MKKKPDDVAEKSKRSQSISTKANSELTESKTSDQFLTMQLKKKTFIKKNIRSNMLGDTLADLSKPSSETELANEALFKLRNAIYLKDINELSKQINEASKFDRTDIEVDLNLARILLKELKYNQNQVYTSKKVRLK